MSAPEEVTEQDVNTVSRFPMMRERTEVVQAISQTRREIDVVELLLLLWRRKWIVLAMALAGFALLRVYAEVIADPVYSSSTKLAVDMQSENVVDIESVVTGGQKSAAAIKTELEVVQSRELVGLLVDELDLMRDPEFNTYFVPEGAEVTPSLIDQAREMIFGPPRSLSETEIRDRTVDRVLAAIGSDAIVGTYAFLVHLRGLDPEKTKLMANTLADLYIQNQIDVKFHATEQAVVWLSERTTELKSELEEKENLLKQRQSESQLVSAEALGAVNLQAKDLRDRLTAARESATGAEETLVSYRALTETSDWAAMVALTGDPALRRLLPDAQAGDANRQRLFNERFADLTQRVEMGLERTRQQITALEASYARLQEQIGAQSSELLDLQQLERDIQATRVLYENFLARLKETTVQRGLQQADSRILSRATRGRQVAPRATLLSLLGFFMGGLIGAAAIILRQTMHNGFRTAADLEHYTRKAVIGQIPAMPIRKRGDLIPYLTEKPTSAAAEAVRNLRTSILLSNIDNPPQIIMSTSSVPGEGNTTQAIALAHNLASLGKRVLLIEGDIRRRTLAEYFNFSKERGGIVEALSGAAELDEVVLHDNRLGIDVLLGERTRINAADFFSSHKFEEFIATLRQIYDFVIIDTPPVLVVPDARVIGQHTDAIIFTVAWDKTGQPQVSQSLRELENVGLSLTGLVLSQIDPKGMKRYGYGGKYGAYASYGNKYYDAE